MLNFYWIFQDWQPLYLLTELCGSGATLPSACPCCPTATNPFGNSRRTLDASMTNWLMKMSMAALSPSWIMPRSLLNQKQRSVSQIDIALHCVDPCTLIPVILALSWQALVEELEQRLEQYHSKGVEDAEAEDRASKATKRTPSQYISSSLIFHFLPRLMALLALQVERERAKVALRLPQERGGTGNQVGGLMTIF